MLAVRGLSALLFGVRVDVRRIALPTETQLVAIREAVTT
jgi:hypothetical protein